MGASVSVSVSGDYPDEDVIVTADVDELWASYAAELLADGMKGKAPEEIIRHVYAQNCDAPELEVESEWL